MKKMMSGMIAALIVVLGLAVAPTAAQAHTGDMSVTAVCNTATGQYDLTATLTTANTRLAGQTQWRVGSERFEGTPSSNSGMTSGPVASQGAQTITLGSFSLPGSTIGHGPWVYAFTTWTDGFTKGSDGQLLQPLAGDCKIPEPPFDGVTKYTPNYSATCEAAMFSHPAIKTGFGVANVYGVRYGATQAEAQAKPFDAYTPGAAVTMPFADSYVDNSYYFELKVGYDGQNLTHQIGQTRGTSEACDRPVPEQPAALTGEETRDLAPICIVPADGTAEVAAKSGEPTPPTAREKLIRDALEKVREIGEAGLAGEPLHSIPKDIDSNWGWLQSQWPVVVAIDTALAAQPVLDPEKVAEVIESEIDRLRHETRLYPDVYKGQVADAICEAAKRGELS